MISQSILELVMSESETMVTEWADTRDGPGYRIIEEKISGFLIASGHVSHDLRQQIITNVRTFVLQDMAIMGW
jgi:hypothetical protein